MAVPSHWPMNLARMMVVEEARSRTLGCVTNELSIGALENSRRVPESSERINALARLMPMILSLIFSQTMNSWLRVIPRTLTPK